MCVKHDILATLSYFDLFDYPLTQTEIFQFLGQLRTQAEVAKGLYNLTAENWIFKFDEFYSLQNKYALITRRRQGNAHAREMLKTAEKIAGFLSAFPFVRGVAVSGSLSKNFADHNSDIDFFIVTAKNRLWLARSFMHLFKKLAFLAKKEHWFCMNYYIDEEMLQIREKNIYTATEIETLLPLRGIHSFREFYVQNRWSRQYLPNHSLRISYMKEVKKPLVKKAFELLLDNFIGNFMDRGLMKFTAGRWQKKTKNKKLNNRGIVMSLDSNKHYAKPDPRNFQEKLVQLYEKKLLDLFKSYEGKAKTIY